MNMDNFKQESTFKHVYAAGLRYSMPMKAVAEAFALHDGQTRRDGVTPYVNHVIAVTRYVADITNNDDTIVAALLHDTIEDCGVTKEYIAARFNNRVAHLVDEVTNPSRLLDHKKHSREERKAIDIEHIGNASWHGRLIKLADRYHNVCDYLMSNDYFRRERYKKETLALMEKLVNINEGLYSELERVVKVL